MNTQVTDAELAAVAYEARLDERDEIVVYLREVARFMAIEASHRWWWRRTVVMIGAAAMDKAADIVSLRYRRTDYGVREG